MRYKGKYVALVTVDIDTVVEDGMLPFETIKDNVTKYTTQELKRLIDNYLFSEDDGCTVVVNQQYADLYEVEDEKDSILLRS